MLKVIHHSIRIGLFVVAVFLVEIVFSPYLFAQGSHEEKPVFIYYGGGFGLNDYGLGVGVEKPVSPLFALYGNAGWGGWGMRYGTGVTFYPCTNDTKTGLSLGYSYATGMDDHVMKLSTTSNSDEQDIGVNFEALSTINVLLSRNYNIGHHSKLVWSVGYAFLLSDDNYTLKNSELKLDADAERQISLLEPGGFIFGLRFMFGS